MKIRVLFSDEVLVSSFTLKYRCIGKLLLNIAKQILQISLS